MSSLSSSLGFVQSRTLADVELSDKFGRRSVPSASTPDAAFTTGSHTCSSDSCNDDAETVILSFSCPDCCNVPRSCIRYLCSFACCSRLLSLASLLCPSCPSCPSRRSCSRSERWYGMLSARVAAFGRPFVRLLSTPMTYWVLSTGFLLLGALNWLVTGARMASIHTSVPEPIQNYVHDTNHTVWSSSPPDALVVVPDMFTNIVFHGEAPMQNDRIAYEQSLRDNEHLHSLTVPMYILFGVLGVMYACMLGIPVLVRVVRDARLRHSDSACKEERTTPVVARAPSAVSSLCVFDTLKSFLLGLLWVQGWNWCFVAVNLSRKDVIFAVDGSTEGRIENARLANRIYYIPDALSPLNSVELSMLVYWCVALSTFISISLKAYWMLYAAHSTTRIASCEYTPACE